MDGEADAADDEAEHGRGKRHHEVHGKRPEIPGRKRRQRRPERDQRSGEAEHRSQPDTEVETGQETLRFKLKVIQDLFRAGGRGPEVPEGTGWEPEVRRHVANPHGSLPVGLQLVHQHSKPATPSPPHECLGREASV